jgi:uncharacterized membrane protein
MRFVRVARHLAMPDWWALRAFPKATLRRIEQAVVASERRHRGELRFVLEANLPLSGLLRDQTPRQRAIELFGELGVWDTEFNCGVLIYLQMVDRRVEIVADRGINQKVGEPFWNAVCRRLETAFGQGQYEAGVVRALEQISLALVEHFPASGDQSNELPDAPLIR